MNKLLSRPAFSLELPILTQVLEFMLDPTKPTQSSISSLTRSSWIITATKNQTSINQTCLLKELWMLNSANKMPLWSLLPELELGETLPDTLLDLVFQRNKDSRSWTKLFRPVRHLKETLRVSSTHLRVCLQKIRTSLLPIISFSRKEIDSWKPVTWTETGHLEEVSSITMIRPSWSGLMKRINSELSLCRKELESWRYSIDFAELQLTSRLFANFPMTIIWVISLLAQPILELLWEPLFISSSQSSLSRRKSLRLSLPSTMSKLEESTESTASLMTALTISLTSEDLEGLRKNLFKTWSMESKLLSKPKTSSEKI